jgi:Predicted membrane protein
VRGLVFALGALPAAALVARLITANLGVNPVETLLHGTGIWALRFLLITLAITPLRWLTGLNGLVRLRRQIGLWAFFYAIIHFSIFAVFEHSLVIATMLNDVAERPYILVGTAALMLLIPLALTSTTGWIRRLGRNWKRLHWLVYPAGVLGLVHFFWLIKPTAGLSRWPMR